MLLYRILASLDAFYLAEKSNAKSRSQATNIKPQGSGVGFGVGPRTRSIQANPLTTTKPSKRDLQLLSFFRGIAWILSTSTTEEGLLDLMRLSLLDVAIEELLRNDSITDLSERMELSAAFLTCLESIGKNPNLAEFYTQERDEMTSSDGLERIIRGDGQRITKHRNQGGSVTGTTKSPPLLDLMDNLGRQAEAFSKTLGNAHGPLNNGDRNVINSVNLSRSILAVRQLLHTTANQCGMTNSRALATPASSEEVYRGICSQLAYDELPSSFSNGNFHYARQAMTVNSVNQRRTITLAKELSTMATSLPPGIFVRNIANRPDCIKALIAGPEGTPYFGGLFEFDIFATPNYPAEPPRVHFLTTSQSRVRFNPNLYA